MKNEEYQEILNLIEIQENEFYFREFQFGYLNKPKKRRNKLVIGLVLLLCIGILSTTVIPYISNIISIENRKKERLEESKEELDNRVYSLNETLNDQDIAYKAQYVRINAKYLPYLNESKGVVINSKDVENTATLVIVVDNYINKDNSKTAIDKCYSDNGTLYKNLSKCLEKDKYYIISKKDKAIIDEDIFFEKYYEIEQSSI